VNLLGDADIDEVAGRAELEAIVRGYSAMAGFGQSQVNREPAGPGD
jgi:hypothetical protein